MNEQKPDVLLYDLLIQHFNLEELRTLCFRLGVDFDALEGGGKEAKARELVLLQRRRGEVRQLGAEIQRLRPELSFELPPDEAGSSAPISENDDPAAAGSSPEKKEGGPLFQTDVSGGEVGQVINVDKLEGGLNINKS